MAKPVTHGLEKGYPVYGMNGWFGKGTAAEYAPKLAPIDHRKRRPRRIPDLRLGRRHSSVET